MMIIEKNEKKYFFTCRLTISWELTIENNENRAIASNGTILSFDSTFRQLFSFSLAECLLLVVE